MSDKTLDQRPLPKRPENGLLAWQATIGYISQQYSLDAMLTAQAYVLNNAVSWGAAASWGTNREEVADQPSLEAALRELWRLVDSHHVIFEKREHLLKRPANYADHEWLDKDTAAVLNRVLHVTSVVYGADWQVVLAYQPVESPDSRFQTRLLALGGSVQIGGRGPDLRTACRDLYRNAAPYYVAHGGKNPDEIV
jgi:hypothetical protein